MVLFQPCNTIIPVSYRTWTPRCAGISHKPIPIYAQGRALPRKFVQQLVRHAVSIEYARMYITFIHKAASFTKLFFGSSFTQQASKVASTLSFGDEVGNQFYFKFQHWFYTVATMLKQYNDISMIRSKEEKMFSYVTGFSFHDFYHNTFICMILRGRFEDAFF